MSTEMSTEKKEHVEATYKYCQSTFKEKHEFAKRSEQCLCIRGKYPDKIPIIVEKMKNIKSHVNEIAKTKYLIPDDLIISHLICIIRKYLNLSSTDSIYLFANDVLLSPSETIYTTYGKHKDADGFLYIFYTTENTFG